MASARTPSAQAKAKAQQVYHLLRLAHPDAHCELDHKTTFQLLCATVMSAQTTDVAVNKVTPALFKAFPDAKKLAKAEQLDVEPLIATIGMYRQKAKNIIALSKMLVEKYDGEVPRTLQQLIELPGVGRKTANVVLGVAFGTPEGMVVDTHIQRISQRLGWSKNTDPLRIEQDLMKLFPKEQWNMLGHTVIFHGRRVCDARKPNCADCTVNTLCPSAFKAELVGRK